jgi:hypothetical protein
MALPAVIMVHAKPIKTFNKICPLIMLANNRTDKLITVMKYETTSIITSKGINAKGVPAGKKNPKASILCSRNII